MADVEIAAMAATQHGVVTLLQARALGLSERAVERRVASGTWRRMHAGVYALAGAPSTDEQRLQAAILASGSLAAVSHRAAVRRWGHRRGREAPLEISTERERGLQVDGVIVHRSRDLRPEQLTMIDGLPVTNPARTLVDLGQVEPWFVVRDFLEDLVARRITTVAAAHAALLLHSRRGRAGCGALRHVLEQRALLDRPAESVLEAAFADLCRLAGLPIPVHQLPVRIQGRERRIDFAYPELMIAIEVDGFEHHATATGFTSDRVRGNDLALAGWTVLHFTWNQIVHQPGYVASVVRRARPTALP
jgi:very-short-patch-repair endonuclease